MSGFIPLLSINKKLDFLSTGIMVQIPGKTHFQDDQGLIQAGSYGEACNGQEEMVEPERSLLR